ncbi:MAG: RNA pseudouridine synthase [Betaproteobacteria bacterium]
MTEPVRLAKRLAEQLSCSRREAETYIEGGFVTVDGKVVEEPQFRVTSEAIVLRKDAVLAPAEAVTILLYQPAGAATVAVDEVNHAADDESGIRILKRHFTRLSLATPLEAQAAGLVVLTQDWRVTRKLVDNAATVEHEFVVEVGDDLSNVDMKQFDRRSQLSGRDLPPVKASMQSENRLRFAIKGPQPGQIAHLCLNAGLRLVAIKRIRIGRISMAKLQPGQWRYLPPKERF